MAANRDYFQGAIKRHNAGGGPNANQLLANYQKATKGLDQNLAFKALEGGREFGDSDRARYDALVKQQASQKKPAAKPQVEAKQRGQNYLKHPKPPAAKPAPKKPAPKPPAPPKQTVTNKPDNRQTQNVKQDNDINTNINGDNNKVFNEQDNSIRQYGGDNRSFVYNSGGGKGSSKYEETPVSAATMGGFYDVDDSPAAQAKFNDLHSTINRDKQKRYAGDAMKVTEKYMFDARDYTPQSMENYLNKSIQYSYDRADRQTGATFGDIWNPNYINENWQMPDPPKEIKSNASQIAKDAKEDIEDI